MSDAAKEFYMMMSFFSKEELHTLINESSNGSFIDLITYHYSSKIMKKLEDNSEFIIGKTLNVGDILNDFGRVVEIDIVPKENIIMSGSGQRTRVAPKIIDVTLTCLSEK